MPWTNWRKVAEGREWFGEKLDWDGPACYELSTAGPQGGDRRIHYVGETTNERKRVANYARNGSHLSRIINQQLRKGWALWYRAQATKSKAAAKAMQNRLLDRFDYDWNIQLNTWGKL